MSANYSNLGVATLLQQAIALHQRGSLTPAAQLYRQILQLMPRHPDANHNLASLLEEQGTLAAALPLYALACATKPDNPVFAQSYADARLRGELALVCAQFPVLFAAQDYARCETLAREVLIRDGECPTAWKYLGAALLVQSKPCIDALQTALRYAPNDAGLWSNLGAAFHQAGQSAPALAHCLQALHLNPQFVEAHLNLGLIYQKDNAFDQAAASYQAVLAIAPDTVQALSGLSVCYKELGDFAKCQHTAQRAITAWLTGVKRSRANNGEQRQICQAPVEAPKVMCVESAHITMQVLRQRLDAAGIAWCLYAGSCLGVVRDGDFLPYDKDIDIAIPAAVSRQQLMDLMTADGCFKLLAQTGLNKHIDNHYSMAFSHTAQNIGIDFFFLHPDGEHHFITGFEHPGQAVKCRLRRFDFAAHPWVNGSYSHCPIPMPAEQYLEDVYGKNWRIPDAYYDTVLSNPNRMAESLPVVLCYGYCRLIDNLMRQNWPAATAYCEQILVRTTDPIIVELQQFLQAEFGA